MIDGETFTGRDVVNETIKVMSWIARTGVAVHTAGRPFHAEAAKGALVIVADGKHVWKFCEKPQFNKYDHMNLQLGSNSKELAPVNVLNIFKDKNVEAFRQLALDFITDGAMVVDIRTGNVIASGVTVLDLKRGSRQVSYGVIPTLPLPFILSQALT